MRYGVVETDNYGGDYPDERYVVACWLTQDTAQKIADLLNDEADDESRRYWKVVEHGYALQPGFEP